jgi:hypothetical protein
MSAPNIAAAVSYRDAWYHLFVIWRFTHWTLLILLTGGSAAVASTAIKSPFKDWLALFVAVIGAIFAAVNPGQRADAYREAWVTLNIAAISGGDVVTAYSKGEDIISEHPTQSK